MRCSQSAYIETTVNGFPADGVTSAAAKVPGWDTANSPGFASISDLGSSHSMSSRSDNCRIAWINVQGFGDVGWRFIGLL
jgi:hypothetical protein